VRPNSTGSIAAGGKITLRVRVTLAKSTAGSVAHLVKLTSVTGTPTDAVKVIFKAK
jgi:hypothetical protein